MNTLAVTVLGHDRPGILAIFNNVAPGREAEFEEWFQHEHLAERIAIPGFLIGRRHEAISGQPRYFNFYVTQSVGVLKSTAYLGRLDAPTPMTRTVMSWSPCVPTAGRLPQRSVSFDHASCWPGA